MGEKRSKVSPPDRFNLWEVLPKDTKGRLGEIISVAIEGVSTIVTRKLKGSSALSIGLFIILLSMLLTYTYGFIFQDAGTIRIAYASTLLFGFLLIGTKPWQKSQTKTSIASRSTSRKKARSISKTSKSKPAVKLKRRSSNRH